MGNNPPKLLLADDESHIRIMMKAAVKTMGYELVGEATNGLEAVDRFSFPPAGHHPPGHQHAHKNRSGGPAGDHGPGPVRLRHHADLPVRQGDHRGMPYPGGIELHPQGHPLAQIKTLIAETWGDCQGD
jgi:hypothetical protein